MDKAIIFWLLLAWGYIVHGQVATIVDKETGGPIELVTITNDKPNISAMTNSKGQADITVFKESDKMEFRVVGYKPYVTSYAHLIKEGFVVKMSPAAINLDEVVVSASHWRQKSSEVSNKIVSISSKSINLLSPQTTADLLAISGKVFVQKSQQGGGSPMIRGFSANRLLYSVDGVRMNTAIFRGGNIQNVISLDPFTLERTEVLFGPGSVIYGSDAIGGVMSFTTLAPQLSLTGETLVTGKVNTRYSSANDENTGHIDINVGGKKWAGVTSITSSKYDDLKMGSHGPDEYLRPFYVQRQGNTDIIIGNADSRVQTPSGYSQMNVMQKLRYQPNDAWDFQYGFHYSGTSVYARYDRHIQNQNGQPRYGEWNYGPQKWMMNNLNINHRGKSILFDQFTLGIAQQYFEESRVSRGLNQPAREIRVEKVDAYSMNFEFIKSPGSHKFIYGFDGVQNDVNSSGTNQDIDLNTSGPGASRYPKSTWKSLAAYVSDQLNIGKKITINAGLRYSQYILDAIFDTAFYPFPFTTANVNKGKLTGGLGLIYRPDNTWVISTHLSTAYRSPNVDDIGKVFDSEPGAVTVPNPDLEAEYAYNLDVSLAKVFNEIIKVDLTAYFTKLENALVRRDFTLNGLDSIVYDGEMSRVQALMNAAETKVFGVQAGMEIKLPAGFGISSDFNYQKGEEELDDGTTSPSRHAPPMYGVSRLNFTSGKLNMKVYAVYSGEKTFEGLSEEEKGKTEIYAVDANGNPWSPGWYTLNFKAMYQLTGHFMFTAGLENITDQRYRPYSSGIAAPGRNFILALRANF